MTLKQESACKQANRQMDRHYQKAKATRLITIQAILKLYLHIHQGVGHTEGCKVRKYKWMVLWPAYDDPSVKTGS